MKSSLFCSPEKRNFVFCLLIFVFTLVVYNSLNRHRFVNYDDDRYVTENPHVRAGLSGDPIAGAFTSTEQANWHPLSWISHALDYQLFRLNPAGHHFTRVVLHAVNGALLFLIAVYATGRALPSLVLAFIVRASPHERRISGLVAERKNVLSTFFFFATLAAYAWYTRNPNRKRYLTVLFLFACGLMSKPMLVTLPFVLLLLDHWPLQRTVTIEKRIVEKHPLFALSVAIAIITMFAQQTGGAMPSSLQFPFGVRLENGIVVYAAYLWKMIWPMRLAPLHPHPGESLPGWQLTLSLLVVAVITALVIKFRAKKYLRVGWLWFQGTLVPVIGLCRLAIRPWRTATPTFR